MIRRHLAASVAAVTTAASMTALATGTSASAEESDSPLRLVAPSSVTVQTYDGYVYDDFGIRAATGPEDVEIWSKRPSYDQGIQSTWRRPSGDVALPADTMTSFNGLRNFLRLRVRRLSDGRVIRDRLFTTCLGSGAERIRPEAQPLSPYPEYCPYNPYTKGSVMGVPAGWAAPAIQGWGALKLAPGRYEVTANITTRYNAMFSIPVEDRSVTSKVRVVRGSEEWFRQLRAERRAARVSADLQPAAKEPSGPSRLEPGPRPDLQSLPAFDVRIAPKNELLRFAANVWNAGDSPLVLDGFRDLDEDRMTAYQYFFNPEGEQVGYQQVGEMQFHAENHQHWHFEDFATYRLLSSDKEQVRRSGKQSFCLAATDLVDATVPGAEWQPDNTDLATACGGPSALSIREVLQSGNGDTYEQYRAGQAISVKGLPNGVYYLSVLANPNDTLIESDTANNESLRKIRLGGRPGARTLRVYQVGIIDENAAEPYGGPF